MSRERTNVTVRSVSFLQLLTVLFVGLKLTDYVDWSWWWVLAPLWGPIAFLFSILALICIGGITGIMIQHYSDKMKDRRKE